MVNVENLTLGAGFDYALTFDNANVTLGHTFYVNGSALGAADTLTFDGSAETSSALSVDGGAGDDIIWTGAGDDTVQGLVDSTRSIPVTVTTRSTFPEAPAASSTREMATTVSMAARIF